MIVTCVQKWEAGEKQRCSTFLLCSESVIPGRSYKTTILRTVWREDTKIEKGNGVPLIPVLSKLLRKKNRYIPYFSKTTQRNDAHGSKMSDESKVDQLRRNCSAQIKQPQKGKIKSNNLYFYLTEKEGGFCIPCPSISPAARLTRFLFKQ